MNVAIMQPYFFPYIGYLQLMAAVDTFVFLDDVQYIERGWVNRNRIRLGGQAHWLGCAVRAAPRALAINQREYLLQDERHGIPAVLARLRAGYARAPHYDACMTLLGNLLAFADSNVARFNENLLHGLAGSLGLRCTFCRSSEVAPPNGLRGQARLIEIARRLGARRYINPIGGRELYHGEDFAAAGVELRFLRTKVEGQPLGDALVQLSIIDWLMMQGNEVTRARLADFDLEVA